MGYPPLLRAWSWLPPPPPPPTPSSELNHETRFMCFFMGPLVVFRCVSRTPKTQPSFFGSIRLGTHPSTTVFSFSTGHQWNQVCPLLTERVSTLSACGRFSFRLPPGPPGWPLLGNIFQLDMGNPIPQISAWREQFGNIFRFHLFGHDMVVVGYLCVLLNLKNCQSSYTNM